MASFAFGVYVMRNIAAGEEPTVSYADVFDLATERQAKLSRYGFSCTCPACKDPTTSDRIRAALKAAPAPNMDGTVSLSN